MHGLSSHHRFGHHRFGHHRFGHHRFGHHRFGHHRFGLRERVRAGAFPAAILLVLIAAIAISLALPWK
jgi:hypothetical protein